MEGYERSTYGRSFVDVYDDWYEGVSSVDDTVRALLRLAEGGPVLELGVGTGRIALPLAAAGAGDLVVEGIDASAEMLDVLRGKDRRHDVLVKLGDMVDDLPPGPFRLAFVAYNTFFNLLDEARQRACFHAVARSLGPGGRFVIEAFVPEDPPRSGSVVEVRSMTADRVVLSLSVHDPDDQRADGHFVELTEAGGVRLRPWAIRYATPRQLDTMAAGAGFELEHRWAGFSYEPWVDDADRHVSVYRRTDR